MKNLLLLIVAVCAPLCTMPGSAASASATPNRPNVLMIAVDDLNHWVGYLGRNTQVKTPNIDRLARRGVRFTRSYCAAPSCNPSRAALMSGLLPATTGVYDNRTDWRPVVSPELPLTSHFKKHGYRVAGAGKIYHDSFRRPTEWSDYQARAGGDPKPTTNSGGVGGIKFAPLDCADDEMQDYRIVSWVIAQLEQQHSQPLFLACGLRKPHMPWNVPRKYYDLYPLAEIKLPPTLESDLDDIPPAGVAMAAPQGDHARMVQSGRWKEAVQAYLAAISFTDMNIGRLLDALDRSSYKSNTVILAWGDHGWHLGEKEHWRKFTLWEEATRAPLVWVVPGVTRPDTVCGRTVDFMSIYPTLADVCGLPIPLHVEGVSIRSLLENPSTAWPTAARTTFGRGNHAVRTEEWRYIRYRNGDEELYDESADPLEHRNLAALPEHRDLKVRLARMMPTKNAAAPARRGAAATVPGDDEPDEPGPLPEKPNP